VLRELDKNQESLWHFKYVADNDPENYKANFEIGHIYIYQDDLESAGDFLKKCL
jgi:hypothetical protein